MKLFTFLTLTFAILSVNAHANTAKNEKPYEYEDRELWFELPQEDIEIAGDTISFTKLDHEHSRDLILFIGENAEPNNGDAIVVEALAKQQNVWYMDTPDALFIDRTRIAMRNNNGEFMQKLMSDLTQRFEKITLVTFDVMSVPVLRGLKNWQSEASETQRAQLTQVYLLYPSFYIKTPKAGEARQLFPITFKTALPITIMQPELGAQANTIDETINALKQGGSLVELVDFPRATDGIFKFRDIQEMADLFPAKFWQAQTHMQNLRNTLNYPIFQQSAIDYQPPKSTIISGLNAVTEPYRMPDIRLQSFAGEMIDVAKDHQGKALLINFWATWCPHCVEEIPSMNRALAQLDEDKFSMISISYKDTQAIMAEFLTEIKVDFPILMDRDGTLSNDWNVFAFPSSFLVDKQGMVRYSINSGAIWDDPEMIAVMQQLSEE